MEPITREEILMAAAATGKTPSLTPITREEMFLAKAAGMDVNVPEPITRKEMFLSMITGSGNSGEVVDGLEIVPDFSAGDYEVVAPNGLLVRSAIIKKPKTLVPENIAEGVEIAGVVGTHVGVGSSGDNRVKYVTFVYEENGETKEYSYPVIEGDTCHDPAALGLINPTKESTAQYNYTFYGWGASDGGAANANILKNITEDKTVYAIFTATVRYYTITYLDDDGVKVLKTESLAYGTTPSYIPVKEGYKLSGWTPEISVVTEDATYTVAWIKNTGIDLFPRQVVDFKYYDFYASYDATLPTDKTEEYAFVAGETIYVEFDGVVYTGTVRAVTLKQGNATQQRDRLWGNARVLKMEGKSTTYTDPLANQYMEWDICMFSHGANGKISFFTTKTDAQHTIRVYKME